MNYLSEEFPTQVSSLVVAVLKKVGCFRLAKKVSFTNSMLWKGFILLYRFVSVLNELESRNLCICVFVYLSLCINMRILICVFVLHMN